MIKVWIAGHVSLLLWFYNLFAKAGFALGGFKFMLAIASFLLLLVGLLAGVEYLVKNRPNLFTRFKMFLKRKF